MERSRSNYLIWLIVVFGVIGSIWLVGRLSTVLTPFITAAVLAYILDPLVDKLETHGLRRITALSVVMLGGTLMIATLLLIVVPMLVTQGQAMAERLPALIDTLQHRLLPWLNSTLGIQLNIDLQSWRETLHNNAGNLRQLLSRYAPQISQSGALLLTVIANISLLPVLLFYFLHDWDTMVEKVGTLVPRRWFDEVALIARELDEMLGQFLRGQLSVMLLMAMIYGGGLALVGLHSGLAIGIIAGLLVFIPYVGAFIGLLLATLAAILQFDSFTGILLVWGVFFIGQMLESFLITPYLVGERIGLSPVAVIFSLMAFGELMGFVGVLLALPLAAITLVIARHLVTRYFNSSFYQRKIDP